MFDADDCLLFALSAWRETSWPKFKELYGHLYLRFVEKGNEPKETIVYHRHRTLQTLEMLGHCDVYFGSDGGRLFVAPSVLARLPIRGLPQAVLCGSRGPDTIGLLEEFCRRHECNVHIDSQRYSNRIMIPQRIVVEAESSVTLGRVGAALQIMFAVNPPTWTLLTFAPDLEKYLASLTWTPPVEINWQRHDFSLDSLQFSETDYETRQPLRLSRYKDPTRTTYRYYLWGSQGRAQVDPSWGRYAVLRAANCHVLVYDPVKMHLAVPSSLPLPRLFGRSAVLCTGCVPLSVQLPVMKPGALEQLSHEVYRGVSPDVAQAIASKLGQVLVEKTLRV